MRERMVISGGVIKSASAHAADIDNELDTLRTQNAALREALRAAFPLLQSYENVMVNDLVDDGELSKTRQALHLTVTALEEVK